MEVKQRRYVGIVQVGESEMKGGMGRKGSRIKRELRRGGELIRFIVPVRVQSLIIFQLSTSYPAVAV